MTSLDWFYFGDAVCLTTGRHDNGDFVQALVNAPLGPAAGDADSDESHDVDRRLRSLFKPLADGHGAGAEAPLLRWIRRAAMAAPVRTGTVGPGRYPWRAQPITDLDVRIVWGMPPGREFLLTPTALYVSWTLFAHARRNGRRLVHHLQALGVDVPKLPDGATDGDHMWVDAALDAGDVLAKHLPGEIPTASDAARHALGVMAELRERDGRPDDPSAAVGQWPSDVAGAAALDVGTFAVEPDPNRPRDASCVEIENGGLTFVLGMADNKSLAYCPWPCGALAGCEAV